jgi:carbamoyl-phosphate synthase large subunit
VKTILITGIGGDIAQGVASIVRRAPRDYRIVGIDQHEQHGGSLFVDVFRKVPNAVDPGYVTAVVRLIRDEAVAVVLPMTESELAVLNPMATDLAGVTWITPGARLVALGIDKLETYRGLARLGIAMPWTAPVAEGPPRELPCMVKERFGSGSRGVFVANDRDEATWLASRHPGAVFQQYVGTADREVTCAVYRTADGRTTVLQLLRRLVGGLTGWARVIHDREVDRVCRLIAENYDLRGSTNIQLRLTDEGPRIFEINPRFSSTVVMRDSLGFRDVLWSLAEIEGERIEFPEIAVGRTVARTQGAAVVS